MPALGKDGAMTGQIWRAAVLVGSAIAALAVAQPALGYTELKVTGTVGVHSLRDTGAYPGAVCLFDYSSANSAYKLKHIAVDVPRMKAVPGMGIEDVAYSFTVQRRIVGLGGTGPWEDRYTSPKYRAATDSQHNADFGRGAFGVKVVVPFAAGGDASAEYRTIATLYWFKSDGTTILGTAKERVDWYYPDQGYGHAMYHHFCPDYD